MGGSEAIVGHQNITTELQRDIERGNIAHAYLFTGPRHIGKFTVGKWFARELLLGSASEEERRDWERAMDRLIHPDFLVLDQLWIEDTCEDWGLIAKSSNAPQKHRSKPPKARSDTIGIEDIRALQDTLLESGAGLYRCCLIRSIERMQEAAANAFLKILEEPPEGRVFILTTETLESVLPTIVSRTRVLRFSRLPKSIMQQLLSDLPEEDAQFLLHLAQGAPGTIYTFRSDPDALRTQRLMHAQASSYWHTPSIATKLQLLEPLHRRSEEASYFLLHLALTLREHPAPRPAWERALRRLMLGFQTNAQRQLLTQCFVLATSLAS